jgi:hypothetical protein
MTHPLSRRDWLRLTSAGVVSYSLSGWLSTLANETATDPQRKRSCILLWMNGGPSQMDTFDLKPGHNNGGPYKPIATNVPGIQISEHLPHLAKHMDRMVLVRSMKTPEGEHERATFHMRTGYRPEGAVQYPALGALLSKELGDDTAALPNYVSVAPYTFFAPAAYGPGFLGPHYAPLVVGGGNAIFVQPNQYEQALKVQDLAADQALAREEVDSRLDLLGALERDFITRRPGLPPKSHQAAYERAVRLMKTEAAKAFELDSEAPALRDAYGRNMFGQGCLLARRLVERGVPFVEVTLATAPGVPNGLGWDTHQQNFDFVSRLCNVLDPAWSTLMLDLQERGLLDSTLIVWMGEFGRTPRINEQKGRDHWANSWTTVLAGGGLKGGAVVGRTSKDGASIEDRPVAVQDFMATICMALGLDPRKQNPSNVGRPIRLADPTAKPIKEVLV